MTILTTTLIVLTVLIAAAVLWYALLTMVGHAREGLDE